MLSSVGNFTTVAFDFIDVDAWTIIDVDVIIPTYRIELKIKKTKYKIILTRRLGRNFFHLKFDIIILPLGSTLLSGGHWIARKEKIKKK